MVTDRDSEPGLADRQPECSARSEPVSLRLELAGGRVGVSESKLPSQSRFCQCELETLRKAMLHATANSRKSYRLPY